MPDYIIKEWNEDNYDVTKNKYMADAYKEKKWAFVSDYCRIDVVHEYGGIYLDTDVEVIKKWDDLLNADFVCGFESRDRKAISRFGMQMNESVAFGLGFASIKGHKILKQLLNLYETLSFYNTDGSLNLISCPVYQTQILVENGMIANGKSQRFLWGNVYSAEYFCPQSNLTEEMLFLTSNTYSIHHFTNSWNTSMQSRRIEHSLSLILPPLIAHRITNAIVKLLKI